MLKKLSLVAYISLLSFTSVSQSYAAQLSKPVADTNKLSTLLSTIEVAHPIVRVGPKYPKKAAKEGREGWVKLSFVIGKEGSVSDVIVMETSGSDDFAKEAVKAVKKWKYKPAFENGEAIEQSANNVQLDFRLRKNDKDLASKRFQRNYKKGIEAFNNKDYKELESILANIGKLRNRHLSANNYFQLFSIVVS